MSVKTILVIVLVPVALAIPMVLVRLVVRDKDMAAPRELVRHYGVATAEYYGVRLDEKASPRDVVYVLLRSVEDLYEVADAPVRQEQVEGVRRVQEIQLALAAPEAIVDVYVKMGTPIKNDTVRNRLVLRTVLPWARMLGYYVGGMGLERRASWQESIDKSDPTGPAKATVNLTAKKDAFETQIIVKLAKESNRWRIYGVDLAPVMPKGAKPPPAVAVTRPGPTRPASKPAVRPVAKPPKPSTRPAPAPPAAKPVKKAAPPSKPKPAPPAPASKPTPKAPAPTQTPSKPKSASAPSVRPAPKSATSSQPASKPTTTRAAK